jgi:hypothetical protein
MTNSQSDRNEYAFTEDVEEEEEDEEEEDEDEESMAVLSCGLFEDQPEEKRKTTKLEANEKTHECNMVKHHGEIMRIVLNVTTMYKRVKHVRI